MRRVVGALLGVILLVTSVPRAGAQPAAAPARDGEAEEPPARQERSPDRSQDRSQDRSKERSGADSKARTREARAHFLRGEKAFNLAKFSEALAAYEAAYEASPLPALLFNIAQCHRNLGDHERAIFFYRRYLTLEPRSKNRQMVLELIDEQEQEQDRERATRAALAAPRPAPVAAPSLAVSPAGPEVRESDQGRPLYRRWWVWAVAGAVAVGVTAALLQTREGPLPRGQLDSVDRR